MNAGPTSRACAHTRAHTHITDGRTLRSQGAGDVCAWWVWRASPGLLWAPGCAGHLQCGFSGPAGLCEALCLVGRASALFLPRRISFPKSRRESIALLQERIAYTVGSAGPGTVAPQGPPELLACTRDEPSCSRCSARGEAANIGNHKPEKDTQGLLSVGELSR